MSGSSHSVGNQCKSFTYDKEISRKSRDNGMFKLGNLPQDIKKEKPDRDGSESPLNARETGKSTTCNTRERLVLESGKQGSYSVLKAQNQRRIKKECSARSSTNICDTSSNRIHKTSECMKGNQSQSSRTRSKERASADNPDQNIIGNYCSTNETYTHRRTKYGLNLNSNKYCESGALSIPVLDTAVTTCSYRTEPGGFIHSTPSTSQQHRPQSISSHAENRPQSSWSTPPPSKQSLSPSGSESRPSSSPISSKSAKRYRTRSKSPPCHKQLRTHSRERSTSRSYRPRRRSKSRSKSRSRSRRRSKSRSKFHSRRSLRSHEHSRSPSLSASHRSHRSSKTAKLRRTSSKSPQHRKRCRSRSYSREGSSSRSRRSYKRSRSRSCSPRSPACRERSLKSPASRSRSPSTEKTVSVVSTVS